MATRCDAAEDGGPFKLELFEQRRNKAHSVQGLADVDFFNFGVGSLKEGQEKKWG